jgi:hypothetical protein
MNVHWANLIPITGSLIEQPSPRTARGHEYVLKDGRKMYVKQMLGAKDNIHKLSERTIRRRLEEGVRDPKQLFAPK